MSKKRTENSKYRSPSTGDYCTGAQYLAEIICQRCADKDKVGTLPYKFWNLPKWNKLYIRQVGLANKLVKKYGDGFITFVKSKKGNKILSLGMKGIEDQYKRYAYSSPEKSLEIVKIETGGNVFSRPSFNNNSLSAKLNRMGNG